jgi:hypothetical protein
MYMGRYCPKEGKNDEKQTFYFVFISNLIIRLIKMNGIWLVIRAESKRRRQRSETRKKGASN